MANDAEPYIAAVADACHDAGLIVAEYGSDDIDPRDGIITLVLHPDTDPDEDWRDVRVLGWDEQRGWIIGALRSSGGELISIYYIGGSALPDPADVAEDARKVIEGEFSTDELRRLMGPVQYREQEDEDGFEVELDAYRTAARAAGTETTDDRT